MAQVQKQTKQKANNFMRDFVIGGVSAAISETWVAPIDRVKLLLQNQDANSQVNGDKKYKGITDWFTRVVREQGIRSMWRGNLVNLMRYFPIQALNFALKDSYKRVFNPYDKSERVKFFLGNVAAGGAAGATSLTVVYPLDFARTRLAVDIGRADADRQFKGLGDCLSKIIKSDGCLGFYRGYTISVIGIFCYRGAYFGLYDTGKPILFGDTSPNFFAMWAFAQTTTTLAGWFAYPLDTVRRRMMMQSGRKYKLYQNTKDCFKTILRKEGAKAFYKGAASNILRGTGSSLVLVLYSKIQDYIGIE